MTTPRQRLAGDEIDEARLLAFPPGSIVEIDPSPNSWARAKPILYRFLAAHGRGPSPRLRFVGIPSCAFGTEYPMLRTVADPSRPVPDEACLRCRERARCSLPASFSDELSPFGPADPVDRWRAHAERLARVSPLASGHALIEQGIAAMHRVTRPETLFLLEPSLHLGADLGARVVIFFGELTRDPAGEAVAHREGLARLNAAAEAIHATLPPALVAQFRASAPFPMPIGFEQIDGAPMLKIYARLERFAARERRAFIEACLATAGTATPARMDPLLEDTEMVCMGIREHEVTQVKAYVRRDPRHAVPEVGLAALAPDHALLAIARPGAYAVVDLYEHRARPPKWDLNTRGRLLTGPIATRMFSTLEPSSRGALEVLFDPRGMLIEVVAVAARDERVTLYFELC